MILNDRSSMYTMMDFWMKEVAPKYFDMSSLSLSRVGLFGFVNEICSNAFEDMINENSILYNDIFMGKAILPESILSYASLYGVDDINAKPSSMEFALVIREDILLENSIRSGGDSYFIVDRDTEIIVEDEIKFLLDYDIKINIKHINNKYVYSARYVSIDRENVYNNFLNPLSDMKSSDNPFLKLTKIKHGYHDYIYIFTKGRQLEKEVITKTIYEKDFINYFTFDIDFSGQDLADFVVMYREPDKSKFYQIEKRIVDSAPTDKPFCFYQVKDEDSISVSFSAIQRYFRPEFNSELKFEIYTTKGDKGIFSYSGDNIKVIPKSNVYDYRNVILTAKSLSDSVGGQAKKTYDEIKREYSYLALTSKNIGTTIDLNKYFQNMEKESKMLFVKKRDDVLERIFSTFVLMKDMQNNIIPTNTLNLKVDPTTDFDTWDDNTKRYVIKAGNKFIYKPESRELIKSKDAKMEENEFMYSNPYVLVINKNPFTATYYQNSLNEQMFTDFNYINDSTMCSFIANKITVRRDAINNEDDYKFEFSMIPNIPVDDDKLIIKDVNTGKFISASDKIKVKAVMYDKENRPTHYFDFNMTNYDNSEQRMHFTANLKTDDYISANNSMRFLDSIYVVEKSEKEKDTMIQCSDMDIRLFIFFEDEVETSNSIHNTIPGMEKYSVTNIFKISDKINLINNMTDIMRSVLKVNDLDGGKYDYLVKEVPFVRYDYIKNPRYTRNFIRLIYSNAMLLRQLKYLTNNFSIDFKFYNTYGKAAYFFVNGNDKDILDKTNIVLKMTIKLNPNKLIDEALRFEIREFIKDYIESINDGDNLYISNLIRRLENEFRDIRFIKFNSINNYPTTMQLIEKNFPTDDAIDKRHLFREFVPEFLNLNKRYDKDIVENDVLIEFI